ncbi:MAG TPA: hypothetical protein VLW52_15720 [Opitutaceae bacterium]|nr:hypothetical protein [Opitutaceae bacterium]
MKRLVPIALALVLALSSACSLLHHKSKESKPAELPPSAGIEAEFRDRWMAKRVHELLTGGTVATEEEAKRMAAAEFAKQYPLLVPAEKKAGR